MPRNKVLAKSLFTGFDIDLFNLGKHYRLYEKFGAHLTSFDGISGCYFAVWAPHAKYVSVIGEFNQWSTHTHILFPRWDKSGIWEGFIPGVGKGEKYKFHIINAHNNIDFDKSDPYAYSAEQPPATASVVWRDSEPSFQWSDQQWLTDRSKTDLNQAPVSVYELHLGSWKKPVRHEERWYSYEELTDILVPYVVEMGFTHVELMPIMEHPYFPSWGYQVTGYFAPTSRYGTPEQFKKLVDAFHQNGIGVILDWVPSHFPSDGHGLNYFDGNHLYEHPDPRKGYHQDWQTMIFDYARPQVRSFLISSALFWLDEYHIDGLRVDAVASMVYLDYSRKEGGWIPNKYGGNEYLEAIDFLRDCNDAVKTFYPNVMMIAEESTAFPRVTHEIRERGLGFHQKWMMGWMHDTLEYFQADPWFRKHNHHKITFSMTYAFSEKFMLALSHDEVVHGKKSLLNKMPGTQEQKFANLRLLYAYMFSHPGSKLLFMGSEFGQWIEWAFMQDLDWNLLEYPAHQGIKQLIRDLNTLFKSEKALFENQFHPDGFEWLVADDNENSVLVYKRKGKSDNDFIIVIINFTPVPRRGYKFYYKGRSNHLDVLLNTNSTQYGQLEPMDIEPKVRKGAKKIIELNLPPLTAVYLKPKLK